METTILYYVLAALPLAWVLGRSLDGVFAAAYTYLGTKPTAPPLSFERKLERSIASDWWSRVAS
ncbi:MAG: hypothetical protein K2W95_00100 [Candidatus Obscuribacterales bacterium]|nr:hypothetical protein [Candidatus Obscuribacterales bacterium]